MFFENAEEAMSRYESEELMVAASMPAITTPAASGGKSDWLTTMKIFSAELAVLSDSCTGNMARPIMPMYTAAVREMTTQTVMAALEPMIILIMALLVGIVIAACMAPMVSMYSNMGNL